MKKDFTEAEMKIVYLDTVDIICGSQCSNPAPVVGDDPDQTNEMQN